VRLRWCFLAVTVAAAGCSESANEAEVSALLDGSAVSRGTGGDGFEVHDFGPVLARGQSLRHQFQFTNSTKRAIRLTGATATTPCCSGVGPIPEGTIPPGGACTIPVALKAVAERRERKQVGFLIQTDSPDRPTATYALRAALYPDWETQMLAGSSTKLPIGRAGRQLVRIACARVAGAGDASPAQVTIDPPLAARFVNEPREQPESESVALVLRDVEVALPASSEIGTRLGTLRFRWTDGKTRERTIVWQVVSPLSASPSRLILRQADREVSHTVVIRSFDDRPFRVSAVERGNLVERCEFSHEPDSAQTVKLQIDPDRAARQKDAEIVIRTDRGDQPAVSVRVIVLPAGV
jgi:hypothetical protein